MDNFTVTTPSGKTVQVQAASERDAMLHAMGSEPSDVSTMGSFGRGALSMLPLGNQAYAGVASLAQNEPYTQERKELTQEQVQDKEQNPGATLAGKATGLIAPIVATSGLAAPETLLGAAAQGAGVGGLFGAGNAIDTLAGGGSGTKAAGDVALGAGFGAAGGAAGHALQGLLGEGAEAVKNSDIGQRLQAENISKALGLGPGALKALGKETGSTPEAAIHGVWQDIQGLPGLPEDFVHPTGNINEKLGMLQAIKDRAGKEIGAARSAGGAATTADFPEGMQAAKDLVNQSENYVGIPDGSQESMKAIAAQLQAAQNAGKLNFDQMSQIRSAVGDQVRRDVPGSHQIYRTLSNNLDNALDRIGDSANIDKGAFQAARKAYSTTSKLIPLMQRGAGREASGTGGGLSNLLGIGGTLMGHSPAAIAPVAHEVQKIAAPEMLHNIMLGGLGTEALNGVLPQAGAQAAASQSPELEKQRVVNDYVMSQRSPAAAKQASDNAAKARENPVAQKPQNMAAGGVVSQIKDALTATGPAAGFTSTLEGLQNVAHDEVHPPPESPVPVRTAAIPQQFHQPFNPQMVEQLKAYLLSTKDKNDEP